MYKILKFRLQDGNLYDFKYYKYSEFIDNLEPEPGSIIDVLEPFTLENFESAQIEYNKYLVYKEALEDIITRRKLWSKEELKEFSKYGLDNSVLEWLVVEETKEDKEIKEKLSLDSFKIREIKSDSIILYHFNESNMNKFLLACLYGHLRVAQWLYSGGGINIHAAQECAFSYACIGGNIEMIRWLYSLGDVNVHVNKDIAFSISCRRGYLEIAQWLWSLGGFQKNDIKTIHQPIKEWLATL